MADLPWYDGPTLNSPDTLLELSGTYRADSLLVSYAWGLEEKADKLGMDALSKSEQAVLGAEVLEREINSGGFFKYLDSYSPYLPFSKAGLLAIGHDNILKLLLKAEAQFGATPDNIEALDEFDLAYYDLGIDLADDLIRLATAQAL